MRCFYHNERDAIGTCKSCGKGICHECAADLKKGLACKGRCEADVQALLELIARNIEMAPASARLLQVSKSSRIGVVVFYFLMGLIFTIGGYSRSGAVD